MSYNDADMPLKRESGLSRVDQRTAEVINRLDAVYSDLSNKLDRLRITKPASLPVPNCSTALDGFSPWVAGHLNDIDRLRNLILNLEDLAGNLDV